MGLGERLCYIGDQAEPAVIDKMNREGLAITAPSYLLIPVAMFRRAHQSLRVSMITIFDSAEVNSLVDCKSKL